jgi:hypothetical protein
VVSAEGIGEDRGNGALRPVDGLDLLAAFSATLLAGIVGFGMRRRPGRSASMLVRMGLLVPIGGLVSYLLYGAGWLRPETWLLPGVEPRLIVGRLTVAALAFVFGLASLVLERSLSSKQQAD